jgi:DnaJ-class molecular chaperone
MRDYYSELGVGRSADKLEIRLAFRRLALIYHPDVHPGRSAAVELFRTIIEAYEVLSNPMKRAHYDEWCRRDDMFPGQVAVSINPPAVGWSGRLSTSG